VTPRSGRRAPVDPSPDEHIRSTDDESAGAPRARRRMTLDLARDQHRFIKRFAVDADTDASSVLRTLLNLLEEDSELAERVVARLEHGRPRK
jgi:hypothetical protein